MSITIPALRPKVYKYDLHWDIRGLGVRVAVSSDVGWETRSIPGLALHEWHGSREDSLSFWKLVEREFSDGVAV